MRMCVFSKLITNYENFRNDVELMKNINYIEKSKKIFSIKCNLLYLKKET